MGEKPLSIDEALGQTTPVGGAGPLGGADPPPPGMAAAGINTTRSNIKNSGGMVGTGGADALDAAPLPPPVDGGGGGSPGGGLDDDPPDLSGAAGIITTRSNIKHGGSAAVAGAGSGESSPEGSDDSAGIAIKEQGVKYGGEPAEGATSEAGGTAGIVGEPIPGIDVKLGKNPGGGGVAG